MNNLVEFTLIKNDRGNIAKEISLTGKSPEAELYEGRVKTIQTNILEFVEDIGNLAPTLALMTGIKDPQLPDRIVVSGTEDRIHTIARTKDYFTEPTHGAILFKDVDAVQCPQFHDSDLYITFNIQKLKTADEVYAYLIQLAPEIQKAPLVIKPSSSSYLWNTETQTWHTEGKGFHVYIFLKYGYDTKRVSDIIDMRSFNHSGWLYVSKNGSVERRCLFDKKVCSPERIIFAAPPLCIQPLVSRAAEFIKVYNSNDELLDTVSGFIVDAAGNKIKNPGYFEKLSDKEYAEGEHKFQKLRTLPLVADAVTQYKKRHVEHVAEAIAQVTNTQNTQALKEKVLHALETNTLFGDFPLLLDRKTGEVELVETILKNKALFHGRRIPQPFEPNYGNGKVAYLDLLGHRPRIYSHGHGGGHTYYLLPQRAAICINEEAMTHSEIKTICENKLGQESDIFHIKRNDRSHFLCQVMNDGLKYKETQPQLINLLESKYSFVSKIVNKKTSEVSYKKTNCPEPVAMRMMGGDIEEYTHHLIALQKYPIYDRHFELTRAGYNPTSKLYQLPNAEVEAMIPPLPTDRDLMKAYETLWEPFKLFPFDSNLSRSTFLAGIMGSVERPMMVNQPAMVFYSNQSGSGKTLLANCLRILTDSEYSGFISWARTEELDKIICSCIDADPKCLVIDNVKDGSVFHSDLINSILTAGEGGTNLRLFGTGKTVNTGHFRLQVLITGNNIAISKDSIRRFLSCRLCNEETATPYLINYEFHPETVVKNHIQEIYAAVLTILKAYAIDTAKGRSYTLETSAGSYSIWNELVRKPICWFAAQFPNLDLVDPYLSITANTEASDELLDLEQFLLAFEAYYTIQSCFHGSEQYDNVSSSQIWKDYSIYKQETRPTYIDGRCFSNESSKSLTRFAEALECIYLSSVPNSAVATINLKGIGQVLNRYVNTPVTIMNDQQKQLLILKKRDAKRPYRFNVVRKTL